METLLRDLRFGARSLARTPGFSAAAILSLALGIGANTTIFSVVDAVLLRPLPYPAPEELLAFRFNQSPPDLRDLRAQGKTLRAVAGYGGYPFDLATRGEPEQLPGALISGPLFEALGVEPASGRGLTESDDRADAAPVVVISAALRRRILGDREALGATLQLSGKSFTVVGVMPAGFKLPDGEAQLWVPLETGYPEASQARGAHFLTGVARLARGATRAQAQLELDAIAARLAERYPAEDRELTLPVLPLQDRLTRKVRATLLLLLGAVGMVLLVACANFAGLLLARGAARQHELAVRAALGASRARLLRQLLVESALLAFSGGAAAMLLAAWSLPALLSLDPGSLPPIAEVAIDRRVLAFALVAALGSGLCFGLLPALQTSRLDLLGALNDASPRSGYRSRLRSALVIAEVALAVLLLTGAGLVLRSIWKLREVRLGFDPAQVLTLRVDLSGSRYGTVARQTDFFDRLLEGARSLPGVQEAGLISELPMSGFHLTHNTIIEGAPPVPEGAEPEIGAHVASPGYFSALRIPLLAGRLFDGRDRPDAPQVVIVNAALAKKYFPGRSAVGGRLRHARDPTVRWMTVVGVVGDARDAIEQEQEPAVYSPYPQNASAWHRWETLVVRAAPGAEAGLWRALKTRVWATDPQLPVTLARPMDELVARSLSQRRLELTLLGLFAALALVLGAIGIYGLVAYSVTQRTHEIGVRLALGATRGRVLALVLGDGLRLAVAGLALGLCAAAALSRITASYLYGVAPNDPPTYATIALVVGGAALLASWLPARRAGRIEPMAALRHD